MPRPWTYRTSWDLKCAGYKCRGIVPCPLCGASVEIWQIPGTIPVFLDPATYRHHLETPPHADLPPAPIDGKSAAAGDHAE